MNPNRRIYSGAVLRQTRRVASAAYRAAQWLGRHELAVLLGLLVTVAGVWAFVVLAGEVFEGDTQAFDESMVRALRQAEDPALPLGPRWLAEAGRDVTALGGVTVLVMVIVAVAGFLLLAGKRATMTFVLVATLGGIGLSTMLKAAFQRPRPSIVPHLSYVYTSSFPSGHSMMAAVVYLTLGALLAQSMARKWLKFYFLAVAVAITAVVGASRVYLGVHYPTDVLAGWTAGFVWAVFCWLVARLLRRRGAIEEES